MAVLRRTLPRDFIIQGMSTERGGTPRRAVPERLSRPQPSERVARLLPPGRIGPFVRQRWRVISMWFLLSVGLVVQVVVIALVYELVDLTISLMEVWAELARKHLEITLWRVI